MLPACPHARPLRPLRPRGAGLQKGKPNPASIPQMRRQPVDFSVAAVAREDLAIFAAWPRCGTDGLELDQRIEQPKQPGSSLRGDTARSKQSGRQRDKRPTARPAKRFAHAPEARSSLGTLFLPYVGKHPSRHRPRRRKRATGTKPRRTTPSAQVQLEMTEDAPNTVSPRPGVAPASTRCPPRFPPS